MLVFILPYMVYVCVCNELWLIRQLHSTAQLQRTQYNIRFTNFYFVSYIQIEFIQSSYMKGLLHKFQFKVLNYFDFFFSFVDVYRTVMYSTYN